MEFYDYEAMDEFDDGQGYEADYYFDQDYETAPKPNGAPKAMTPKKKALAKAVAKTASKAASRVAKVHPAKAARKAETDARNAIAKVEQELYETLFEADYELDEEIGSLVDPELLEEMYEMADYAADAETDEEADEFLGALGALAAKAAPMLLKAAPHIISAFSREDDYDEFDDEADYYFDQDYEMDYEGDQFIGGAIAGLAKRVLPVAVKGIGRLLRSRGARRVIRQIPGAVLRASSRTMRSSRPTVGNLGRHLAVEGAKTIFNPTYPRRRRGTVRPMGSVWRCTSCRRVRRPMPRRRLYRRR